jgi:hypothetical protein
MKLLGAQKLESMAKPVLDASRVVSRIGQGVAAGVAQHIVSTWLGF